MSPAQLLSLGAALGGFALYLAPCAADEARRAAAWWRARTEPIAVCRGCGSATPAASAHRRAGVPFCSPRCAEQHPNHYPEEHHP